MIHLDATGALTPMPSNLREAEELVLSKVETGRVYSLDDLARLVAEDDVPLREAIWDLLDRGKLRLTWDQRFEVADRKVA